MCAENRVGGVAQPLKQLGLLDGRTERRAYVDAGGVENSLLAGLHPVSAEDRAGEERIVAVARRSIARSSTLGMNHESSIAAGVKVEANPRLLLEDRAAREVLVIAAELHVAPVTPDGHAAQSK